MILTIDEVRSLAHRAMEKAGHSAQEADVIADHLVDCELRGLSFGGLARALSIIERMRASKEPRRPITVVRETAVSGTIDGGDQVGYLVADKATNMAIEKTRSSGIAVVGAHETWYTGMYSYYLERITNAGFVGMIAGSAPQKVAPHGGTEARFGTNPIAFGFPTDGVPVIWDIGTAAIMAGEVALAARLGELLPEGRAYDSSGEPTRDPIAAATGAWRVWGGHKGSGLAVVVQLLGMMAGAAADPVGITDCGFVAIVIDPAILTSADDYLRRASAYSQSLKTTRPLDPEKPVRVPFERSAQERTRRLEQNQIDVSDEVLAQLATFVG